MMAEKSDAFKRHMVRAYAQVPWYDRFIVIEALHATFAALSAERN